MKDCKNSIIMICDKQIDCTFSNVISGATRIFLFLSILSGHLTLLWYYPLWSLSFTGAEISLIVLPLSGLAIGRFKDRERLAWFVAAVCGLYVPANAPLFGVHLLALSTGVRLGLSAIGLFTSSALTIKAFHSKYDWAIGVFLFNVVKFSGISNNPLWPIAKNFDWILFAVALYVALWRKRCDSEALKDEKTSMLAACKLATTLYLIDNFMSEPSGVQLWSLSDSFSGNRLLYSDLLSMLYMVVILFASLKQSDAIHPAVGCAGLIGGVAFFSAPLHELRFLAGLVMSFVLFSTLCVNVAAFAVSGRTTIALGMSFYILLSILHMAGVAYAFIPFGWLFREKTFFVFLPSLAIYLWPGQQGTVNNAYHLPSQTKKRLFRFLAALLGLATIRRISKLHLKSSAPSNIPSSSLDPMELNQLITRDFGGLPTVRVGIWAVHFGIDQQLFSSEKRIAKLIEALDLDVAVLVESDLMRPLTGQRDLGRLIASEMKTKYFVDYGPSPRLNTWGCTLLSRHEIVDSKHFILPSPDGELACAILASIKLAPQVTVSVLMAHNGQEEDVIGRRLQSAFLADLVRNHPPNHPLIYAGYLVAKPHSEQYHWLFRPTPGKSLAKHQAHIGPLVDIDPDIHDRWCLYIGHNKRFLIPLGFVRVHHGGITDTELQAANFAVLPAGRHPPDFDAKWNLIVRQVKSTAAKALNHTSYYSRWYFDETLSICPASASVVCEHYYHLRRHYF